MIKNKNLRRLLWWSGAALCIAGIMLIRSPLSIFGWVLILCGILLMVFAFQKHTCPSCGKTMKEMNAGLKNCAFCGASYDK
jgi:uncharacterized membrane protein HdeD (DUF308 family)